MKIKKNGKYAIKNNNKQYAKISEITRHAGESELLITYQKLNYTGSVYYPIAYECVKLTDFKKIIESLGKDTIFEYLETWEE